MADPEECCVVCVYITGEDAETHRVLMCPAEVVGNYQVPFRSALT